MPLRRNELLKMNENEKIAIDIACNLFKIVESGRENIG